VVDILAPHDAAWTTPAGVTGTGVGGAALWVPAGRAPMSDQRAEQFADELADLCDLLSWQPTRRVPGLA
jgi:hypothetical protein